MPFLQHYSPQNFLHLGLDFLFADSLDDVAVVKGVAARGAEPGSLGGVDRLFAATFRPEYSEATDTNFR